MKHYIKTALFFFSMIAMVNAKENTNVFRIAAPPAHGPQMYSGCDPSKSRADLDINNVRCPIWINGDMWWDLVGNALYEVPVGSGKHSLFAGAIWVGGKDNGGQLKVAAQTYRQSGSDFWPGPLDTTGTATISADQCLKYDKHYKITFAEVKAFHEQYQINHDLGYPIPDIIKNWPGNGDMSLNQSNFLAPFYDQNGDGHYDYTDGDYPKYSLSGSNIDPCDKGRLLGDQTIWWVFNDMGNTHGETGSLYPIGIEIQAQAFGFNTNDEVNNMTFYRYKIINRASSTLDSTYFGSWVDPDLGNYLDDYVGCDVMRGLGFCYNGDADDDGALGYGLNPPAVGMDFFEGPLANDSDGIDNNRNGVVDEPGEQIIMSKFVYYNNDNTNIGNPFSAQQYYNYLIGKWKNNSPLVYGGTGYQSSTINCDFMFPGSSDPQHIGTAGVDPGFEWSEEKPCPTCSPNPPSDRRFLQSAGQFTLLPGAVNYITTGVVWARTSSGGPDASVKLLKIADVKAQNLFESCFKILNGPDAPTVHLRELDEEIIISLENQSNSNNYKEGYKEKDSNIPSDVNAVFNFEGYKVYQVKDQSVTVNDLLNADKARLLFQSDIQNGVSQIVNKTLDGGLNAYVPVEEVAGADKGLRHSVRITTDAFATGDPQLINHKTYYFMAVAYAYDSVADVLDPFDVGGRPGIFGQPYIQSRKSGDGTAVAVYTAIPHISDPEANGLVLNTSYNDGPEITRITGMGNGYVHGSDRSTIDLKQDQIESILFNQSNPTSKVAFPTYQRGRGPIDVRIYDPMRVPANEFELWLTDTITQEVSFTGDLKGLSDTISNVTGITGGQLKIGQVVNISLPNLLENINIVDIQGSTIILSSPLPAASAPATPDSVYLAQKISARTYYLLKNVTTQKIDTSERSLVEPYDELFPKYGFSVNINQVKKPGEYPPGGNGAIEGTIKFENPANRWLGFINDVDNFAPFNWILSGNNTDATIYPTPDAKDNNGEVIDGPQFYEKILNGTWAPFRLVSDNSTNVDFISPAPFYQAMTQQPLTYDSLSYVSSVDVIITPDKSKWSRCVVFEMGKDNAANEGGQFKGLLRKHASLNLDGTYSSTDSGYSYFPGYAINVETGERLNIAFGEDSHWVNDNGNDMIWNPSSRLYQITSDTTYNLYAAGKHYIYVFGHKNPEVPNAGGAADTSYYGPAYDGCAHLHYKLWGITPAQLNGASTISRNKIKYAWKDCMWVSCPFVSTGQALLSTPVHIRLRVSKPYRAYDTGISNSINNNLPFYKFGTSDLAVKVDQPEVAKNALSKINVVPNPYYAYSNYEKNQLDNRIKIVNLPPKCEVTIYTTGGTLIRKIKRDASSSITNDPNSNATYATDYNTDGVEYPATNLENSVDWDLKNTLGIPVASGMYLIHIKVDGVGEKTLKWFGVMRPIDLDTF